MNISNVYTVFNAAQVLIDTWWNVNKSKQSLNACLLKVLIDTWWNVNLAVFDVVTFVL